MASVVATQAMVAAANRIAAAAVIERVPASAYSTLPSLLRDG